MKPLHPLTAPSLCNVVCVGRRRGSYLLSIGCFHTQLAGPGESRRAARVPRWRGGGAVGNARYSFSARKLTVRIKAIQRTELIWVGMCRTFPRRPSRKLEGLKRSGTLTGLGPEALLDRCDLLQHRRSSLRLIPRGALPNMHT